MTEPATPNSPQPPDGESDSHGLSVAGANLPQRVAPLGSTVALQQYQPRLPRFDTFDDEAVSLLHYLDVLERRKWLVLAVALTVLVLAALQVFTETPVYKATGRLQIDPEDQNVLPYEQVDPGVGVQLGRGEYVRTQAEKLQSRSLASRVLIKLELAESKVFTATRRRGALLDFVGALRAGSRSLIGAASETPQLESDGGRRALSTRFLESLEVRPLRNTRLIQVAFLSPDPVLAAKVVNTVTEEFIEQHLESKFEATTRATEFLAKQLQALQIQVERSEENLLRYARENNIVNQSERETIARKRLADLSDELTRAETEAIEQRARFAAVPAGASLRNFPEILKTDALRNLEARLSQMESDLAGLTSRYGSEWPAVKTAHSEIAQLERQIATEKQQAIDRVSQDFGVAGSRLNRLEETLAAQRELVDRINEDSIQYNILRRESDSNKELYEGLLLRLKEAGVAAGLRSSNIRVADPAEPPEFADSPKKTRTLVLALALGLFLGVGAAFLAESLENTVKSTEHVSQELGLPALGVIPRLGQLETDGWLHWPGRRTPVNDRPILAFEDTSRQNRDRALEAYRSLRTALLLSHSGTPPQVVLVTSALPSEGKTTTAINTAAALAQTGERTLLIDLDMRKPSLEKAFNLSPGQGMSTYLSGNSDISSLVQRSRFPNLFVVGAGPVAPNPAELIGSRRMDTSIQLLREYLTYVVIDTPPSLELADALILAPRVDGVILVARGGKTPKKALQGAASRILSVGGTLLGVLINDVDVERFGYGYYYGRYRQYYGEYSDESPQRTS